MPIDLNKADYSIFGKDEEQEKEHSFSTTFDAALRESPDEYARNSRLARESGMPLQAVATDPISVESRLDFERADYGRLFERAPVTGRFLTDYNNAVIAQDDVSILESLEKTFDGLGETIALGWEQFVDSADLKLTSEFQKYFRLAASGTDLSSASEEQARALRNIMTNVDNVLSQRQTTLVEDIQDIQSKRRELTPEDLNILQEGVRSGIESLAVNFPGMIGMLVTRNPNVMLSMMGTHTGFSSYGDARAEGLSDEDATSYAVRDAYIEVATELLPTAALEKILFGKETGKVAKNVISFMLREMGGEQIATIGQSLNAYSYGLDEELEQAQSSQQVADIMLRRAGVTTVATIVAGGSQAGIASGTRAAIDHFTRRQQTQEQRTQAEQEVLGQIDEQVRESHLSERSPETLGRFMQELNENPNTNVYLDPVQTSLYLQQSENEVEKDGTLLYLREKLQEVADSGQDLTIPAEEFATTIAGSEHFEPLRESMTLSQDSVAPFRQEQEQQEAENYVRRMVEEAEENVSEYVEAREIYEQVREQLIDTGQVEPRAASTMAELVPAWATVFASRNGLSVQQVYERAGLKIEGPQTGKKAPLEEETKARGLMQRAFDTVSEFISGNNAQGATETQPVYDGGVIGEQVMQSVRDNGGITLTRNGEVFNGDTGYVVSVRSMNVTDMEQVPALVQATLKNLEGVARDDIVVGVFDMGDGRFSVDTNVVINDRDEAVRMGRDFDQQSIWDLGAQDVIETGGRGEAATEEKFQQFLSQGTFNDDGIGVSGEIETPPVQNGKVVLDHFSGVAGIETLDPDKFGTGINAQEAARAKERFWVNRTNYGIATGQPGGYRKERALGAEQYRVTVPFDQLYDIASDPEGIKDTVPRPAGIGVPYNPNAPKPDPNDPETNSERLNLIEKKIKDAGYAGYWQKHPSLGMIAVTFDPQPAEQVGGNVYRQPPTYEHEAKNQAEFGAFLNKLVESRFGGPLDEKTPENMQIIASAIVDEVIDEMGADSAAVDWYKDSIHGALAHAAEIHPEIATDENMRQVFIMSLAITSNGATIARNVENAELIYANWKETGQFDTFVGGGYGTRQSGIQKGFDKFAILVDRLGLDGTFEFLNGRYTVRELKDAGYNISGENMDTEVYGSAIFGPKIGQAFFQNLRGNWDALTMDQWFMKTWGRLTGTMLNKKGEVRGTPANGSERNWIRSVMSEARNKLRDRGHDIDIASMQALLWYREKDFYIQNNVADFKAEATDYEQELEKLANRKLGRRTSTVGDGRDATEARLTARERAELRRDRKPNVFSQDAKAGLTPGRIDSLVKEYQHANGRESKAYIGYVNPRDFINATAPIPSKIDIESGDLDEGRLRAEGQWMFLEISGSDVVGHEGRHRMSALSKAGVDRVPVVIRQLNYQKETQIESRTFQGQRFSHDEKFDPVEIVGMELLVSSNRENILQKFGTGDLLFQYGERGTYDTESVTIRLTEASDLSTFIHEFGHFILDQEMKYEGAMMSGIEQWFSRNASRIAFEASTYMEEKGLFDFPTPEQIQEHIDNGTWQEDEFITRAMHEQFARGFETYLMEGRAPSVEMRGIFATIARWMERVYKAVKGNLNVRVDDEMRQVFDRILATDEQIEMAKARDKYAPLFTDAAMAGMTEAQYQDYLQQQGRVEDKAHETLRTKLIRQLRRQAKQQWKDEKQDIIDEQLPLLREQRVYRTLDRLKNGEVKLDHAAVKEMVGQTGTNKRGVKYTRIPPKLNGTTITGARGVHPDEAAAMFGYNSGTEMLDDLMHAERIDKAAEKIAEAEMIKRHGDILRDGTIEQEADQALRSEEQGKLLLTELKALSRGTAVPNIDRATIKAMAAQQIGKLSYRNITPEKYRKAEIRAAQEAAAALAVGDKETASQAKLRQITNFYLGREAQRARDEIMKIVDRMSRYREKRVQTEIMKAGNEYWEQLVKILERFEFRKSSSMKSVDQRNQDINSWVRERIEQDGENLEITAEVLNELYSEHWKRVPFNALRGIADSVRNIEHVARYSNKISLMGEAIDFDKLVNNWVDHMDSQNVTRFKTQRTTVVEGRKWGKWAMAQMSKIPWVASWLDGGQRVGMSHQLLVQPFTDALNREFLLQDTALKPVVEAMNNRSKSDIRRHNTKYHIPEIKSEENDGNLMGHQIIAVALNTGNQGNLRKLLLGEGWASPDNEAEITFDNPKLQAVLKHMNKNDWDLVQLIWDQMDSLYPQLADVRRRSSGIVPPKVEATPISNQYGDYRGGYYPVKYDANRSQRAAMNEERLQANTDSMFSTDGSMHASVTAGAVNERTGFYDPVRLSLDVVPNHFQEVIHYITHHDAVRQVNKLIRDPRIAKVIKEKLGPEEYSQLRPWLNDIAKEGRETPTKSFIDDIFGRLRFGITLGLMGFKATTGIIQVSGIFNTVAETGFSNAAKAVPMVGKDLFLRAFRRVTNSPQSLDDSWAFALENSKVLSHRVKTMDREMRKVFNDINDPGSAIAKSGGAEILRKIGRGLSPKWMRVVQETSMKHIAYIQLFSVDLPSWHAAYEKKLSETGSEKEAFQYADWVVEQVQGSGAIKDLPKVMRGQTETHRAFTMFMTFFSSLWNAQRDTARGARGKIYSTSAVAAKLMFLITAPVMFEMIMRGQLWDEDEEEIDKERLAINLALFPIQSIPFFRDVASGALSGYGYNVSPAASMLERGIQGATGMVDNWLSDEEITRAQAENTSKLVGAFLGTPGMAQAWATGEHLYQVLEEGEEFTVRELLFGPTPD